MIHICVYHERGGWPDNFSHEIGVGYFSFYKGVVPHYPHLFDDHTLDGELCS
jgi:hypothetical protein